MYKRRIFLLLLSVVLLFECLLSACSDTSQDEQETTFVLDSQFSVTFIDVGEGDSILITLPDGKCMLIDCGKSSTSIFKKITLAFEKFNVTKIDYLVLTHPDTDHVGNALDIINSYDIGAVFLPDIWDTNNFETFHEIKNVIEEKEITSNISCSYKTIIGEDYTFVFLTPSPFDFDNSSYIDFNQTTNPTDDVINDISPIIYLEYKGITFLFTGDASYSQEQLVLDEYNAGIYNGIISDREINLQEIDVLKVSHHGANDATSAKFLQLIKPKNAVISVSGNNTYGHPNINTLNRLYECNESIEIYTTYQDGTVNFLVDENGRLAITTNFLSE